MAARDWAGVSAGLALAGFGLGTFLASGPGGADAAPPMPAPIEVVVESAAPQPAQPLQVEGLTPAVGRVLGREGYADRVGADDLGLPAAVTRVLESEDAVLRVAEPAVASEIGR